MSGWVRTAAVQSWPGYFDRERRWILWPESERLSASVWMGLGSWHWNLCRGGVTFENNTAASEAGARSAVMRRVRAELKAKGYVEERGSWREVAP